MKPVKVLSVVGARPNFIKIASFCREVFGYKDAIEHVLVHTGQHYDHAMSHGFFESLSIPAPDIHLNVGSESHAVQTANIMLKFEPVCIQRKPDWVVVVGDVNSTMACALVAAKLGVKVAHIEAGLRSFDMTMPEEINRRVTDAISDLLFTPSVDACENLRREGIGEEKIKFVGNIMIDTLVAERPKVEKQQTFLRWGLEPRRYAYVTLHRPSNVDEPGPLASILASLENLSKDIPVVFPVHPRTLSRMRRFNIHSKEEGRLILTEPLAYHDSLCLAMNAALVITDSGGLQEETTFLGTPCLTLRPNTERPITITLGTNRLTAVGRLWEDIQSVLTTGSVPPSHKQLPMWDGHTAKRIVEAILETVQ